ncbi:glycosyltransferase family 2 protein [Flavobacteriales bacterium]|nr:glycosyltransferase family 2 protein [Flavobacteriales bacterium]
MLKTNEEPLISVIIPVYNASKYLDEALQSVFNQSYKNLEIIAVNDGSTDNSSEVLEKYASRITIITSINKGIGSARNLGIKAARGEYLAFLDADDIWDSEKLKKQITNFENDPSLDIVYCSFKEFMSPDMDSEMAAKRILKPEAMTGASCGTSLLPRSSFEKVGYFSEELKSGEYIDWFARAKEQKLNLLFTNECLYHRRSHSDNHTVRESDSRMDYLKVLKAALERRRKLS